MDGCTRAWVGVQTDACLGGWMDGWMTEDGWVDGWIMDKHSIHPLSGILRSCEKK